MVSLLEIFCKTFQPYTLKLEQESFTFCWNKISYNLNEWEFRSKKPALFNSKANLKMS
jgi:hypothetical protein